MGQKNLPLAEGDLEWADSVTGKPKAELLQRNLKEEIQKLKKRILSILLAVIMAASAVSCGKSDKRGLNEAEMTGMQEWDLEIKNDVQAAYD